MVTHYLSFYAFVNSNSRLLMADMEAESRVEKPLPIYVPRDEQFEESKQNAFSAGRLRAVLHNLLPQLKASISTHNRDLNSFSDIDGLYKEGLLLKLGFHETVKKLPKMVSKLQESSEGLLKYETPKVVSSKYNSLFFASFHLNNLKDYFSKGKTYDLHMQRTSLPGCAMMNLAAKHWLVSTLSTSRDLRLFHQ